MVYLDNYYLEVACKEVEKKNAKIKTKLTKEDSKNKWEKVPRKFHCTNCTNDRRYTEAEFMQVGKECPDCKTFLQELE